MGFVSVRPYNFRNLEDRRVECDAPRVFLIGDNGQGKTNFIEAVHLLCYGSSFRTRTERRLVREGASEARVDGTLRVSGRADLQISVRLGSAKEITVNGKSVRDRADLLSNAPCVVFCHDDFDFVTGPPERRRWFLNQTLSMSDPSYLAAWRTYRRVLLARNALLKDGDTELLDDYDEQLAAHGHEVQTRRARALHDFSAVFTRLFGVVSGLAGAVELRYRPSWKDAERPDDATAALRRHREHDLRWGTTTRGPHRDTYLFLRDEVEYTHFASTGQLRLCSLMLRVAQAHYLFERSGRKPILLVDDVILELDAARKRAFVDNLPEYEQAFFTFLSDEDYETYRSLPTLSYTVRDGRIEG
jgi:DNA replication and repair protein RecF